MFSLQTAVLSLIFSPTKDRECLEFKLFLSAVDGPIMCQSGSCKHVLFTQNSCGFFTVLVQEYLFFITIRARNRALKVRTEVFTCSPPNSDVRTALITAG